MLKDIFPGDASIVRRLAETLASGESRSEAEALIERPDRREVPVSLVTAALFGKDGTSAARWPCCATSRASVSWRPRCGAVRRWPPPGAWPSASRTRSATHSAPSAARPAAGARAAGEARLAEYTTVLTTEVDRVNRIIEMLLNLARPAPVRPVPLNLHQLLERVALLNEEGARDKRITSCAV